MKRTSNVPKFRSLAEERAFCKKTDSTELVDWSKATAVTFPNLKPTVRSISIRLPQSMIDELKVLANKQSFPYQSLMKLFLRERIDQELHAGT